MCGPGEALNQKHASSTPKWTPHLISVSQCACVCIQFAVLVYCFNGRLFCFVQSWTASSVNLWIRVRPKMLAFAQSFWQCTRWGALVCILHCALRSSQRTKTSAAAACGTDKLCSGCCVVTINTPGRLSLSPSLSLWMNRKAINPRYEGRPWSELGCRIYIRDMDLNVILKAGLCGSVRLTRACVYCSCRSKYNLIPHVLRIPL